MRLLAALLLLLPLPSSPVVAADWTHYVNARFGYTIDVPPGFPPQSESDNGDGQTFRTPTATLTIYGANITAADFESETARRQRDAAADGWTITYQVSTPQNASFSGRRGARILYTRLIALCGGIQLGAFALEYSAAERHTLDAVVDRLVASLRPTGNGCP